MTGTLDALVYNGSVQRIPNPDDRRSVLIEITDEGRAIADRLLPGIRKLEIALLAEVTNTERATLLELEAKANKSREDVRATFRDRSTTVDLLDALDQTFQHAQVVIDNVRGDQYDNSTPCEDWAVRDLLAHTIGVVAALGPAASGASPAKFELGPDPASQFRDAAAAALAGWRTPGLMDKVVDVAVGPMPGRVLAGINLLDTATHTWDIATATGQPAELPAAVAEAALEVSRATISADIRPGRFGPEVSAAPGAGPTDQLVAFLGRTP